MGRPRLVVMLAVLIALLAPSATFAAAIDAGAASDRGSTFDTPAPTPRPGARRTPRPRKTPKPVKTAKPAVVAPAILAPARQTLTVGYTEPGILGQAPLLLAQQAGYFKAAGLTDVLVIEVPKNALRDLRSGLLDIAVIDSRAAAAVNVEDEQFRAIAGYMNYGGADGAYGGDLLLATPGLVAHEPTTVVAFLSAYIRALQDLSDADGAAVALATIEEGDLAVDPDLAAGWIDAVGAFAPFDGGFGNLEEGGGLDELETYLTEEDGTAPDLDALIAQPTLSIAQAALDLPANPASAFEGLPIADISVALPVSDGLISPIVAAQGSGYFTDAGFGSVEVMDVEQPMLGLLIGEVDFAIVDAVDAADGVAQGLPLRALAGHMNYREDGSYGGDMLVASTDLIADEPATVAAFLAAYLAALQDLADDTDTSGFAPFDGGFGNADIGGGTAELSEYLATALDADVSVESLIETAPLEFAQASSGLASNPTSAPLPPGAATTEEGA